MDLYFSPLACSMATRIALYEAGAEANFLEVDPKTKVVQNDGSNFLEVNPLGLVLTENAAILQYVADRFPQAGIATGPGMERSRLHQWLCFIGTELHKGLFVPVLDRNSPPEMKSYVLGKGLSRLDYLESYLKGREFLLDHFSVADTYLVTVINWTMATPPIELARWPIVKAYYERLRAPQHRQGGRGRVQAVPGRTRTPQGGGVALARDSPRQSGGYPDRRVKTGCHPVPAHRPAVVRVLPSESGGPFPRSRRR